MNVIIPRNIFENAVKNLKIKLTERWLAVFFFNMFPCQDKNNEVLDLSEQSKIRKKKKNYKFAFRKGVVSMILWQNYISISKNLKLRDII